MRWPVPRAKADELEAVLSGRRSLDIATPEVRRLAVIGEQASDVIWLPAPDATWQAATRHRLMTEPLADNPAPSRVRAVSTRLRTSARVAAATGTASLVLGSTGLVAAAAESVPGQLLHPLKLATEEARLLLSLSDLGDAQLHLDFAQRRLDELAQIAGSADRDDVAAALVALDQHVAAAIETAQALGDDALWDAIASHAANQARQLRDIAELLPVSQRPLVERSSATMIALVTGTIERGSGDPSVPDPTFVPPPTDGVTDQPAPIEPSPGDGGLPDDEPVAPGDLVPPLPDPLDDVGRGLEGLLQDLLNELGDLAPAIETGTLDLPAVNPLPTELDIGGLLGN